MNETWDYKLRYEHLDESVFTDKWVWSKLRNKRDKLLAESDFAMLPDVDVDIALWKSYRQNLRDLPANTDDPRFAIWPVKP